MKNTTEGGTPVSDTDEIANKEGPSNSRTRRTGEYPATNSPLSAAEIAQRQQKPAWPITTKDIEDLAPLEETDAPKR